MTSPAAAQPVQLPPVPAKRPWGLILRQLVVTALLLGTITYAAFETANVITADSVAGILFGAVATSAALALALFAPGLPDMEDAPAWRRVIALLAFKASLTTSRVALFALATSAVAAAMWLLSERSLHRMYVQCSDTFELETWPAGNRDFSCSTRSLRYWHPFMLETPKPVCLPGRLAAAREGEYWSCNAPPPYEVVDFSDDVRFTEWSPIVDGAQGKSNVVRDIQIVVRRAVSTNEPFKTRFGTSGTQITSKLRSGVGSIDEEVPSSNPPRRIFWVKVDKDSIPALVDTTISYSITYTDNFDLPETDNADAVTKCGRCDISIQLPSYPVQRYRLRIHSLPAPFVFTRGKLRIGDKTQEIAPSADGASFDYLASNLPANTRLSLRVAVERRP